MATIASMLERAAEARPDAPAMVSDGVEITYAELLGLTRRAAAGLAAQGIGSGDRLALWLPNVPAYLILQLACARIGAVAISVNTRFKAGEVGDILHRAGAKALAFWPGFNDIDFTQILSDIDPQLLRGIERFILYGGVDFDAAVGAPGALSVAYEQLLLSDGIDGTGREDQGFALFATSGTTRAPKFVVHAQAGVVRHAQAVAHRFGYDAPDAKLLMSVPFCGIWGFTQSMAAIAAAAPLHILPVASTQKVDEALRAGITHTNGSDEMFRRLFAASDDAVPYPALKVAGYGAFDYPPEETVAMAERRGISLCGLYGMTELLALFARQDPLAPIETRAWAGGYLVSGETEGRVCDPETGVVLPAGQAGELQFRGPSVMLEYFGDPAATSAAFTDDGYLRTGDLGTIAKDGLIRFEARMGDVMRLGGFLTSPVEIESLLVKHETVAIAQVVSVQSPQGNRAVGFVVPADPSGIDEDELRQFCRKNLAGYKVPIRIIAIEEMPTTPSPNGFKIQRSRLRVMAEAQLAEA